MQSRSAYSDELEELRLQVELMGLRVSENLDRARQVLRTGDEEAARAAVAGDDEIDAMNVSLSDRCTALLAQQTPVASDLRLVLSVIRMTAEIERVGDLALRVAQLSSEHALVASVPSTFDLLCRLADAAVDSYNGAMKAWSSSSLAGAEAAAAGTPETRQLAEQLINELLRLEGPQAGAVALRSYIACQAFDRIAEHARVIGARTRYLLTGDPSLLAAEVR